MSFWDSSAIVSLLVAEATSASMHRMAAANNPALVWWGTEIECVSALARRERDFDAGEAIAVGLDRLRAMAEHWKVVGPSDELKRTAIRMLRAYPLRAADALQLAAAFLASEGHPGSLEFVTLDLRLADAARKEGFVLLPAGLA